MEHLRAPHFEPCRPAYPELVTFGVPRGERKRLKDLARQHGTSVSALVRRAVGLLTDPRSGPLPAEVNCENDAN